LIECGPVHDRRPVKVELPAEPKTLGIFVSGGIDSAILYYMMLLENQKMGNIHKIVPLTVLRKEGSKNFAKLVVGHMVSHFNLHYIETTVVGDPSLPEIEQVKSGVHAGFDMGINIAYTGLIEQLPIHMVGWTPIPYQESIRFKAPFKHLNKSHIIDLCFQHNQEGLFYITHSCAAWEITRCRNCNGCNERQWAFDQLGRVDPGII